MLTIPEIFRAVPKVVVAVNVPILLMSSPVIQFVVFIIVSWNWVFARGDATAEPTGTKKVAFLLTAADP